MDIKKLAEIYGKNTTSACVVAEICDEVLDRSGALLGKVRDAYRSTKTNTMPFKPTDGMRPITEGLIPVDKKNYAI